MPVSVHRSVGSLPLTWGWGSGALQGKTSVSGRQLRPGRTESWRKAMQEGAGAQACVLSGGEVNDTVFPLDLMAAVVSLTPLGSRRSSPDPCHLQAAE